MKFSIKSIPLSLFFAVWLIGCSGQHEHKQYVDYADSSGFSVENADSVSVENLEILAKVWGFAKGRSRHEKRRTAPSDGESGGR